jgi:hypothetical protein
MNGELVQVQSGGLDLKSSILRPCINFLYFVANGCGRSTKDEELDLPLLYWVPKLHSYPYTQHCIAGSAICPKVGVTQMWILRKSKDLLEYIHSRFLSSCNSIKTFDFSTIYTTIPPLKAK